MGDEPRMTGSPGAFKRTRGLLSARGDAGLAHLEAPHGREAAFGGVGCALAQLSLRPLLPWTPQ